MYMYLIVHVQVHVHVFNMHMFNGYLTWHSKGSMAAVVSLSSEQPSQEHT